MHILQLLYFESQEGKNKINTEIVYLWIRYEILANFCAFVCGDKYIITKISKLFKNFIKMYLCV